jgi:hypothetical protein
LNPVVVNTLLDSADPNDGLTSLREAVTAVQNSAVDTHTISFDGAMFTGGMKTISLTSALPVLRRNAGSLDLRIDGRPGS